MGTQDVTLTIAGGRELKLGKLTYADLVEAAKKIDLQQVNPLTVVGEAYDKLPLAVRDKLLNRAYDDARSGNRTSAYQLAQALDTLEGLIQTILTAARKNHPEITEQELIEFFSDLPDTEVAKIRELRDKLAPDPVAEKAALAAG